MSFYFSDEIFTYTKWSYRQFLFYNSILFKMEETFELYILVEFTLNGKGNIG